MIEGKAAEIERLQAKLAQGAAGLQEIIRALGLETLEAMIRNLSGSEVAFSGGTFRIHVRTGNLRRMTRLDYPLEGDAFAFGVFNRAEYARQIEDGRTGPERLRDLLFGGTPPATSKKGGLYKRIGFRGRTASGRAARALTFFTVTPASRLNDIPPRPFVAATLEQMRPRIKELLSIGLAKILRP